MYFRILKKDLKRKKTMNVILLIFIILASTFVSSSVNNIVTVANGLNYYFEKANMSDLFAATMTKAEVTPITDVLDSIEEINSYGIEHILYLNSENLIYEDEKLNKLSTSLLLAYEDADLNYFDEDDNVIEAVEEGTVVISNKCILENDMKVGDTLEITLNGITVPLKIAGGCKDAALGSGMMGMIKFIINENDFEKFKSDRETLDLYGGSLCYINTGDINLVEKTLSEQDSSIIFLAGINRMKMFYVMDMVIAGVLMVVSVCLILISFVVLRFTIAFTLTEEFREIGVMKAIGIPNIKIRGLYMVKYFMLAVVGAGVGFFSSIPFGTMLLESVSQSMVLGNDSSLLINLCCSVGVVAIILLFCFGCTSRVKKFTPVDAIRSGITGERFKKKGKLRISRSKMKPAAFMAANDVLSSPRRFGTVILTYVICLSLVLILVNTVNTLKSGSLASSFGMTESDVYYCNGDIQMSYMVEGGRELLEDKLDEIEDTLAENGMPGECLYEIMVNVSLTHGDNGCKAMGMQGIRTTMDMYEYYEGTPPQNEDEIALTPLTAKKLNVSIGDTVTICLPSGEKDYVVTALFQNMNNLGEGVRLHEDVDIDFLQTSGSLGFQINFTDHPKEAEIQNRVEKLKEIFHTDEVYTADEYIEQLIGVADTIDGVRILVLSIVLVIIALVTVLMERSFITKERGEIAILKAMGFKNRTIIKWHTIRLGIVSVISTIISLVLSYPLTDLAITPVFKMMGAAFGIKYRIVPLEVYVIYPLIVLAITIISAGLTALYTRAIVASEASSIE
ncbi:MAG: ABC transporter permease [Lachnospiraceae bacterium]|nr:ABC transporter permease [Lachnospiraceae bacterium]